MHSVNITAKFEVRSFTRSWDNGAYLKTLGSLSICLSRLLKVTDFGANRKRVYHFLLVPNSNLGRILHRFGDIAGFLRSRVTPCMIPCIFKPNFRGVPVAPDGPCSGQPGSRGLKLFSREVIFEEFETVWSGYSWTSYSDGRTDRQTDNIRSQ